MIHFRKGQEVMLHTASVSPMKINEGGDIMAQVQAQESFQRPKVSVREMVKNQKGLTLIELLAVIVILAIIAAIAIPSISAIIQNSERKAHMSNAQQLVDSSRLILAAKGFGSTGDPVNNTDLINSSATGKKVSIETLINEGYLSRRIEDPYVKGTYYNDTASYVQIERVTTVTDDGYATDVFHFYVTIVGADGENYYTNTPEAEINNVGHSSVDI